MTKLKPLYPALALVVFTACSTFTLFDGIVTITQIGDSIRTEYATLWKAGLITPEQDAKATELDAKYRQALGVLVVALEAEKAGTAGGSVAPALRAAKDALAPLLQLIAPLLTPGESAKLSKQLTSATAPTL